jgi:carbonic anhydrase/acetyltransferase-like protein (isoleucine patch superfamily)
MPVYALGDHVPEIDPDAFVHPDAVVIGKVRIGPGSSIWPCAVLRGDGDWIEVGARTSIQDGVVVHVATDFPTVVGNDVTVGHQAHLEGCVVEDGCLVGVGSILLHHVRVGAGAIVAAGAVLTPSTQVPPLAMALGVPAKIRPDAVEPGAYLGGARGYADRARRYAGEMRRVD